MASYGLIPLTAEINVALRKLICQKIGSERVKHLVILRLTSPAFYIEQKKKVSTHFKLPLLTVTSMNF